MIPASEPHYGADVPQRYKRRADPRVVLDANRAFDNAAFYWGLLSGFRRHLSRYALEPAPVIPADLLLERQLLVALWAAEIRTTSPSSRWPRAAVFAGEVELGSPTERLYRLQFDTQLAGVLVNLRARGAAAHLPVNPQREKRLINTYGANISPTAISSFFDMLIYDGLPDWAQQSLETLERADVERVGKTWAPLQALRVMELRAFHLHGGKLVGDVAVTNECDEVRRMHANEMGGLSPFGGSADLYVLWYSALHQFPMHGHIFENLLLSPTSALEQPFTPE